MRKPFFKRISRSLLFTLAPFILPTFNNKLFTCAAQKPQHKIAFRLHGGKSDYIGDWGHTLTQFKKPFLQSGVGIGYELRQNSMVRVNYTHGIWGYKQIDSNALNRGFRMLLITMQCNQFNAKLAKTFNPYYGLGAGIRFISGNYRTAENTNRQKFSTENMAIEPMFVISLGSLVRLNQNISILFELSNGITVNDHLDGKSSGGINLHSIDYHFLPSIGFVIKPWVENSCPSVCR